MTGTDCVETCGLRCDESSQIAGVGVFIECCKDYDHVGVYYTDDNKFYTLHLIPNNISRGNSSGSKYRLTPSLVVEGIRLDLVRVEWDKFRQQAYEPRRAEEESGGHSDKVPHVHYGFSKMSEIRSAVQSHDDWIEKVGLTCATFVLTLCESAGIYLLDDETWEEANEEDRKWQEKVVTQYNRRDKPEDIKGTIGNPRYKPTQVFTAALCYSASMSKASEYKPLEYTEVKDKAEAIRRFIVGINGARAGSCVVGGEIGTFCSATPRSYVEK